MLVTAKPTPLRRLERVSPRSSTDAGPAAMLHARCATIPGRGRLFTFAAQALDGTRTDRAVWVPRRRDRRGPLRLVLRQLASTLDARLLADAATRHLLDFDDIRRTVFDLDAAAGPLPAAYRALADSHDRAHSVLRDRITPHGTYALDVACGTRAWAILVRSPDGEVACRVAPRDASSGALRTIVRTLVPAGALVIASDDSMLQLTRRWAWLIRSDRHLSTDRETIRELHSVTQRRREQLRRALDHELQIATDASVGRWNGRADAGIAAVAADGRSVCAFLPRVPIHHGHGDVLQSELHAIRLALTSLVTGPSVILTDSQPSIRAIAAPEAGYPKRIQQLAVHVRDLLTASGSRVEWVKGHDGHPLNECADRLAVATRRNHQMGVDADVAARTRATILADLEADLARTHPGGQALCDPAALGWPARA